MEEMCGLLMPLSKALQSSTADLLAGMRLVDDIINVLETRRQNAETEFHDVFVRVTNISQKLDVEVKLPRRVGRQMHRENYGSTDAAEYYRQSIYIPYVDNMLA